MPRQTAVSVRHLVLTVAWMILWGNLVGLGGGRLGAADTWVQLELKDGTQVVGLYVDSDAKQVTVRDRSGERKIEMSAVNRMDFIDRPVAPVEPPAPAVAAPTAVAPEAPPPPTNSTTSAPTMPPILPPIVPPTATPPAATGPTAGESGGNTVEVPLPALEAGKTIPTKVPLQWVTGEEAPWYKTNKASSLHQMPDWQRASAEREKTILAQVDALGRLAERTEARRKLAAAGEEAVPYLIIFLLDVNPSRGQACADLLIERGRTDVTKYLIEALYATTDENNRVTPTWLAPYARTLVAGCNKFTQVGSKVDPEQPGFSAAEFVEAWQAGLAEQPLQFGEPLYKPAVVLPNAEQQKTAWIAFFRGLALKRVKFTQPKDEKVDLTRKYPRVKNAEQDAAILRAVAELATGSEEEKIAAKEALQGQPWPEVAPYLAQALVEKKDVPTRLILLDIFMRKEDKRATWHVLQVLVESWGSPTQVPPPANNMIIRTADQLLRKLTGLTGQAPVQPTFVGGYRSIQGFIDLWNQHFAKYPEQYGEPELDKTLPKYNEYIAELRTIGEKPVSGDGAK